MLLFVYVFSLLQFGKNLLKKLLWLITSSLLRWIILLTKLMEFRCKVIQHCTSTQAIKKVTKVSSSRMVQELLIPSCHGWPLIPRLLIGLLSMRKDLLRLKKLMKKVMMKVMMTRRENCDLGLELNSLNFIQFKLHFFLLDYSIFNFKYEIHRRSFKIQN